MNSIYKTIAVFSIACMGSFGAFAAVDSGYTERGDETCVMCHNTDKVNAIKSTKHYDKSNPNSPAAKEGCETCHGPSAAHVANPMNVKNIRFGAGSDTPAEKQQEVCTTCHNSDDWKAQHTAFLSMPGMTCSSCHVVHEKK